MVSEVAAPPKSTQNTLTSLKEYHDIAINAPPRDLEQIWKNIEQELIFAPENTERAWYSIPYRDKGKTIAVEGIGIHGFTVLIRHWGYAYSAGVFGDDLGDKFVGRGRFVDLKTMVPIERDVVANRFQTTKDGKTYRLQGKHWDNAMQSAISKAQRNAGLMGIPDFLKERFFNLCKKLTLQEKDPAKRNLPTATKIANAKKEFQKNWGITSEVFDEYCAELSNVDTPEELFSHLKGLYTGIKSGETTIQQVFGIEPIGKKVMSKPPENKPDEQPGV